MEHKHYGPLPAPPESDAVAPAADQRLALVNPFPRAGRIAARDGQLAGHAFTGMLNSGNPTTYSQCCTAVESFVRAVVDITRPAWESRLPDYQVLG